MSTTQTMNRDSGPWYKEPWPWILMGFPFIAVVAGFITLFLAIHSDDGLVVDDYYKEGLAINEVLGQEQKAKDLGLVAHMQWMPEGKIQLQLQARGEEIMPSQLILLLAHPTQAGHDQSIKLERSGSDGSSTRYLGTLPAASSAAAGYWSLVLEDAAKTWRMEAKAQFDNLNNSASIKPL